MSFPIGIRRNWLGLRNGLLLSVVPAILGLIIVFLPSRPISEDAVRIVVLVGLFLVATAAALGYGRPFREIERTFRIGLVVWWFLLVSEGILVRSSPLDDAIEGKFSLAAYGEVILWVCVTCVLVLLSLSRTTILRAAFVRSNKWITVFCALSVLSVVYSRRPVFSLAWAFKLCLIVWLLFLLSESVSDQKHLLRFLWASFWAYVVLTLAPLTQTLVPSLTLFGGGRLSGLFAPTVISAVAAVVFLFSLMFYFLCRNRWVIMSGIFGLVMVLLAGGKTAIISMIVSTMVFFLVQRKVGSAMVAFAGLTSASIIYFFFVPSSLDYFRGYLESGLLSTLTGRTVLWAAVIKPIRENLILGHGYMSSKFVSLQVSGIWSAVHMHGAFLDVLYNNGIVGLVPILLMNFAIVKNLAFVLRSKDSGRFHPLAAGLLALYTHIFLLGLMQPSFGSRPHSLFMFFLTLVVLSEKLREMMLKAETGAKLHRLETVREVKGFAGIQRANTRYP